MKNIKIFAFLAVFLLSAFVSTAWAEDVTLTYKISVRGAIPHAYITNADGKTVCDWGNGIGTLWPAGEGLTMNDDYKITFKPNRGLDKTGKNENKESTSTTAFKTENNTTFTVSVGKEGFYFKSVTFKEDGTEKASSSNIAPNSTSIRVEVPENKFFNYITVVLTNDFPYIDENGKEQIRKPGEYTVLTSLTDVSNLGGGWYVVQGKVEYTNQVKFSGDAHLILADGAEMVIKSETYGIQADKNLTIYGQNEQSGILNDTANGTNGIGIYSYSGDITIIGGKVTATATGANGIGIASLGDITISGGTVTASGSLGYGIRCSNGVTISGGKVAATGRGYFGIHSKGNITLGWTNSTDFIKASGYYSMAGSVQIAEGKSFKDEKGYVYRGTLNAGQLSSLKGQKLEPFEGVSVSFVDNFSGASDVFAEIAVDGEGHVSTPSKLPVHSGYAFVGWFTAIDGNTEFDFTATVTENTTAYAHWNEITPVEYIDENGETQILEPGDYTVLTSLTDVSNLGGGWYVVQGKVKYTNQVKFSDDAHLILADGAEMEIVTEGESEHGIYASKNLTIYGQSEQSGILNDTAKGTKGYGIYSHYGDITISGGKVTATGSNNGIFSPKGVSIIGGSVTATGTNAYGIISSNRVTISGGSVTATGLKRGIYSVKNVTISSGTVEATGKSGTGIYCYSGNITINGGTVEATGLKLGIYSMKNVTISGGSVTATGNDDGIYSSEGNITLGWTNSTDSIKASSYSLGDNEKQVSIAEGKSFKDENGIVYSGTLTGEQLSAIKGKKLEPCYAVTFDAQNGDDPIMLLTTFDENGVAHVEKPNDLIRSGFTFEGWFTATDGNTEFDFTKAVTGNTTAYAHWNENTPVKYIDENGGTNETKNYILLTSDINVDNLPGGWYVVEGEVEYTNQVKFSGDAHLILADGAEMEIKTESEYGIYASKNLTIYGQNGQRGILNDTANGIGGDGIYSRGNITINGGSVTATGKYDGINGSNGVTINGGTVTATGNNNGFYSGFGDITVNGGSVTATGEIFDGIYSRNGSITINGGTVTATGSNNGIYSSEGNITLGWTNSTDSIKASSYYGKNGVSIAEGKSFKDDKGKAYSGTLTGEQLSAIKSKKLEPCYAVALDLQDGKAPVMLPATFDENGVAHVEKPADPTRDGYTFAGWFTTADGGTEFDFSAAITGNTTAYAKWSVPYIDKNGKTQIRKPGEYTVLTEKTIVSNLGGGWYVVQGEVKYKSQVMFSGDAHLILADGAKMEIETKGETEYGIYASNNLTIYGQNEQRGILNDTAKGTNGYGIYSNGTVTINGGSVTATGAYGIISEITINGGTVTATGTNGDGIYSSEGNITISGGTVTATGEDFGIYSNGTVTISGGSVTATGSYGICSFSGDITLGWTKSTDSIKASSYSSYFGAVKIAEGKSFKDDKGKAYRGTLLIGEQLSAIEGKKLEPCYAVTFDAQNGDDPIMLLTTFDENGVAHVAKPNDPIRSGFTFEGWFTATDGNTEFDFSAAITDNTTAYAKWSVPYIDENGTPKSVTDFIVLTEDNKPNENGVINLPGGWYVVLGEVSYGNSVNFDGDAHLILADGATMKIETEGESEHGIYALNNLTIYGQNEQSGILNDTAKGTNGSGIYSYFGDITIIGGKVTATGTNGDGIYSKKGNITINGGTVTASGNSSGINTAGHITLGWTNSTDFIKVSSIHLGADSCTVSIAKGKSFVDENGKAYRDTLTDENLKSIKNKTLTPLMPFPDNIVIANISGATYTGDSIRPEPAVTIGENDTLELGKDYTLAYKDNLNASNTAKVIVKGAGKYYGEVQKSFTIDKAPLKITALNDTIVYGDEPANQGVAYDGFVGNETSEVLKGELALEIGYKRYDDAGKYAITPSGLNADNYKIEFVAGTLTVEPKVISIVWGERIEFDYDGEAHAPTVTAKDFVEGHVVSLVVTGAAVEVGNHTAKVALDENDANSKNYKLRASELEKKFKIVMPIAYIDENGVEQTVTDYTVLTENTSVDNLDGGWYVVQGEVKYTSQVKFSGDAHLILADGAKMEIETKGESEHGIYASNNLTIYGQNEQRGILNDTAKGTNGYGIYSNGTVTINGGSVTATGKNGDGIYSYNGGVTISGGSVTATSTNGVGIYSDNGGVTISGGSVTATGNDDGIRSFNGNITLGWTNSTDFIKASSYYSEKGSVSIAEGRSFKDEDGKVYSGTIGDVSDIAGKTLVPSFNGKFLSGVNIAVADIPVQKYADGEPICPSVLVTDGKDTLNAGTDYMVTCFNNTTVSSARLDKAAVAQITGKGNYAGAIQKRFFIWNNIRDYAAVQVFEDEKSKKHAVIDGEYEGKDVVNIGTDISVNDVVFNREFTPNSGFSTIMLPFNVNASSLTGVRSIIKFTGITKVNGENAVGMGYVWCNATIGKQEEKKHPDRNCNKYSGELKAYTPYMIEMESATLGIDVDAGVTLVKWREFDENNNRVGDASVGNWVFRGTLQKKKWSKEAGIINEGRLWAFAGSARNGASIGKFVQFGGNNWANPFRAYLVECKDTGNGLDCSDEDSETQPSLVSRYRFADALAPASSAENSLSAKTPAAVAASETASLNSMDIVIVYGDSASGERPTVIGRMNPATGEIRMLPRTKQTYDLKGRKVGNGKKAKGAYYRR